LRRKRNPFIVAAGAFVLVGVLVAGFLVLRHPATGPVPIPGPTGPAGAAAWGVDGYSAPPGAIRQLEQAAGRPFGAFSVYVGLRDASTYPTAVAREAMARQALIYLNINSSYRAGGRKIADCWSRISAGRFDSSIDAWASAILASRYSNMVITFEHEPNVDNVHQPKCQSDTPANYRAAFAHVYARMRSDGVRTPFAFVPTVSVYRTGKVDAYAPPPSSYQVVGADVYNRVPKGGRHSHSPRQLLEPMYMWIRAHAPGKPVLIGEIGEDQHDPNAARWIAQAIGMLTSHGNLLAVDWNVTTDANVPYSPLSNAQSRATWIEGARLPYFRVTGASSPGPR